MIFVYVIAFTPPSLASQATKEESTSATLAKAFSSAWQNGLGSAIEGQVAFLKIFTSEPSSNTASGH